jgi:hypothetical protein
MRIVKAAKEIRVVSLNAVKRKAGRHLSLQCSEGPHTQWNTVWMMARPAEPEAPETETPQEPEAPEFELPFEINANLKDGLAVVGAAFWDALLKGPDHKPIAPAVIARVLEKHVKKRDGDEPA